MKKILSILCLMVSVVYMVDARVVLPGESLWAMQRLVTQASCDVTVRQSDFSAGVYTISTAGVYCLAENMTGKILINTDRVVMDLNGKTVSNSSDTCVEVNGRSEVVIRNGSVVATNNIGVSVLSGSSRVFIEGVSSYDCTTGIDANTATDINIHACDLITSDTGVNFTAVSRLLVSETNVLNAMFVGFSLDGSNKSVLTNCNAMNTGQGLTDETANIYGFLSTDGSSNIFTNCVAQNTLALTVTGSVNVAAGFALTGTETESEISECTSSIIQTSASGFAIPYGIQLAYSFDALTTVTGANHGNLAGTESRAVSWSPDGAYLATGGDAQDGDELQLFSFDRSGPALTKVDGVDHGAELRTVAWSPDGAYLASGATDLTEDQIKVFLFDRLTGTLTSVVGASQGTTCFAVSWSPDGAYLATGGSPEGSDEIQIFSFDRSVGTLTKVVGASQGTTCLAVSWSPDGAYLATGGTEESGVGEIQIFAFARAIGTLTRTDGASQGTSCNGLSWSPNGAYLATVGVPESSDELQVFSFDEDAGTLTQVDSADLGAEGNSVEWSPDGAYLATGASDGLPVGTPIMIFSFERSAGELTQLDTVVANVTLTVNWSPDGAYFATGGRPWTEADPAPAGEEVHVFQALVFPTRNIIQNNTVKSAARASSTAAGTGISGSSIENMIVGNTSYNNSGFNYWFVTNVFNERFTQVPTAVQNISMKLPPLFYAP